MDLRTLQITWTMFLSSARQERKRAILTVGAITRRTVADVAFAVELIWTKLR